MGFRNLIYQFSCCWFGICCKDQCNTGLYTSWASVVRNARYWTVDFCSCLMKSICLLHVCILHINTKTSCGGKVITVPTGDDSPKLAMLLSIARGVGINLNQFNFKKDLKPLANLNVQIELEKYSFYPRFVTLIGMSCVYRSRRTCVLYLDCTAICWVHSSCSTNTI